MTKEELSQKIAGLKISRDKKSEVLIEGEITIETMRPYVQAALKEIGRDFELTGFRKGQVPENILRQNLNMVHVWSDAAHDALNDLYPEILELHELSAISSPRVTFTKLAAENPLGFQIRIGLMPEFKLPDYKKIGKKAAGTKKRVEVTDPEIEETIAYIKKSREKDKEPRELTDENVKELGNFKDLAEFRARIKENITHEKEMDANRVVREEMAKELTEATEIELPEVVMEEELQIMRKDRSAELERLGMSMEDYLKQLKKTAEELGNFKDLAEFRARIKENITHEKEMDANRAVREQIAKELAEAAKIELPEIVMEEELQIMRKDRSAELERLGMSMEDYLKQLKKTAGELEEQEKEYVERQLKTRLILGKIAEEEKIVPEEKEVEQNSEYLMRRHPESDPEQVRHYVVNMLTNELVLELLEGKKKEEEAELPAGS